MATFDPTKSSSTTEKLADFCRKEIKSGDDIKLVPGVGPSVQTVLRDNGIDTIAQLLAKFLAQIDGVRDTNHGMCACSALLLAAALATASAPSPS